MRGSLQRVAARTFQALATRNYRVFFAGQQAVGIGNWMQSTAQAWLILRLTHSVFMLGLLVMVQYLPNMLLQPLGGVIADRLPKRTVLLTTQTGFALVTGAFGVSIGLGEVRVWELFVVVLVVGMISVIDYPSRYAFIVELVGLDHLPNAVGLNSGTYNATSMVGPVIAGVLIASGGTGVCFDLNALSYLVMVAALLLIRPQELHAVERGRQRLGGAIAELREGASYAIRSPEVLLVVVLMLVVTICSYNFSVLIPALARDQLHSGATTFGLLLACVGVGSVAGALGVAYLGRATVRVLLLGCGAFGACLALCGQATTLVPAICLLIVTGFSLTLYTALSTSVIQLGAPAHLRGRVLSVYLWVFIGATPIGALVSGLAEQAWGSRVTMTLAGVVAVASAIVASIWWARHRPPSSSRSPSRDTQIGPAGARGFSAE